MADHRALPGRDAERLDQVVEDFLERERGVAFAWRALGTAAEHEALDAPEHASELQVRDHAIDAIRLLVHVLAEEDGAVPVGEVGRAEDRRQHGQVSAEQAPARLAGHDRLRPELDLRQAVAIGELALVLNT